MRQDDCARAPMDASSALVPNSRTKWQYDSIQESAGMDSYQSSAVLNTQGLPTSYVEEVTSHVCLRLYGHACKEIREKRWKKVEGYDP